VKNVTHEGEEHVKTWVGLTGGMVRHLVFKNKKRESFVPWGVRKLLRDENYRTGRGHMKPSNKEERMMTGEKQQGVAD